MDKTGSLDLYPHSLCSKASAHPGTFELDLQYCSNIPVVFEPVVEEAFLIGITRGYFRIT